MTRRLSGKQHGPSSKNAGLDVILAENGEEGVMIFSERHGEIKAVLLDMLMPKKSGKEAYLEMKKIDPGLKVLLASGFKQDERVEAVLNLGVQGFVQKPYDLDTLSRSIFAVINMGAGKKSLKRNPQGHIGIL
ncbi:MAG: response regulator [Desulfobacterales bacterium]|nr:response regulator [Desulfobacterales bacterium]